MMHKTFVLIVTILLSFGGGIASETIESDKIKNISKLNLSFGLKDSNEMNGKQVIINSCCFGCPSPEDYIVLPNLSCLPSNRAARIVTIEK